MAAVMALVKPTTTPASRARPSAFTRRMSEWLRLETNSDPVLERMALATVQWCWDVANSAPPYWLSLLGVCGTGKTHCAKHVHRWLNDTGRLSWRGWGAAGCPWEYDPYVVHWPTHLVKLRSGNSVLRNEDMPRWPFLVLDEVTMDSDKWGPACNALVNLLSARAGKWTFITSNYGMADMEQLDARIPSRLIRDGSRVEIIETVDYSTR